MSRCAAVVLLLMVLCLKQGYADFDIRNVDFLNFTYHPTLCNAEEGIGETVRVRRGEWNGRDSYYHVSKVIYGDLTSDGRDDAAVAISCGPKAANFTESEIHIYNAHENHASLIAQVDDSGLEREYTLYNTDCVESDDNPSCGVWSGVRNLEIIGGQLVVESLAEGYHARPKYVVKFTYQVQDGRLVLAQKPQKPTASEDVTYFDDFSRYAPGSPPSGWLLRGAAEVTPSIMEVGGVGPSYRVLDFPEVRQQLWNKWVLKEGLIPRAPYTITARLNFRKRVADRAGLTIAWNDANWDRVDIQPNVYWGGASKCGYYIPAPSNQPPLSAMWAISHL